jgi:hypothetical protein
MVKIEVQRAFIGTNNLDEIIFSLFKYHLEKIVTDKYHYDKANTIPSDTHHEGVEE